MWTGWKDRDQSRRILTVTRMVGTLGSEHSHARGAEGLLLHMPILGVCSLTRLRTQLSCSYHCGATHLSMDADPSRRTCRLPSAELCLMVAYMESKFPHITMGLHLEEESLEMQLGTMGNLSCQPVGFSHHENQHYLTGLIKEGVPPRT